MRDGESERQIQHVIAREQAWTEAHRRLDLKAMEDILSEEFIKLQADGSILDKPGLLASYQTGERSWEIAESTEHIVRMRGDCAILIGRWRGKGVNHGQRFDYEARFTSVYVFEQGDWRMITEHSVSLD